MFFKVTSRNITSGHVGFKLSGVNCAAEARHSLAFDLICISGRGLFILVKEGANLHKRITLFVDTEYDIDQIPVMPIQRIESFTPTLKFIAD